jgi:hypothetical protein
VKGLDQISEVNSYRIEDCPWCGAQVFAAVDENDSALGILAHDLPMCGPFEELDTPDYLLHATVERAKQKDKKEKENMELKAGLYRHYKGGLYQVIGIAEHSETGERLVVYVSLAPLPGPRIRARPAPMWNTPIVWPDGIERPRFAYVGAELPEEMATKHDKKNG